MRYHVERDLALRFVPADIQQWLCLPAKQYLLHGPLGGYATDCHAEYPMAWMFSLKLDSLSRLY